MKKEGKNQMKLYYTYGSASLLIKKCVFNSAISYAEDINTVIKSEIKKLIGTFNPRLFLGNRKNLDSTVQYRFFKNEKQENAKNVWTKLNMLILGGLIDEKIGIDLLKYTINRMEDGKIKHDIDKLLFFNVKENTEFSKIKSKWDESYKFVIRNLRKKLNMGWNNGRLTEELRNYFNNGHIRGTRKTRSDKGISKIYSYMDGKDVKDIAKRLVLKGVSKVTCKMKESRALTRRNISIKAVNEELFNIINDEEAKKDIDKLRIKTEIKDWYESLDLGQKRTVMTCLMHYRTGEMTMCSTMNLLAVYGYKVSWMLNGMITLWQSSITEFENDYRQINVCHSKDNTDTTN